MTQTRRSFLASAGVGVATGALGFGAYARNDPATQEVVAAIIRRSEEGNKALMRGDLAGWLEQIPLADDFVLMSPFGGKPSHGSEYTPERLASIASFFRNGTLEQEVVETYASPDMVVLVTIERAHVEVGGLPMQPWALRVTQVYRREGALWRLSHRHADPLSNGVSLAKAAALGRGEGTS